MTIVLSKEIARIYQDNIWKLYGVLWKVFSDRGPQFASRFMKDLMKVSGTKSMLSMMYHSQTDR